MGGTRRSPGDVAVAASGRHPNGHGSHSAATPVVGFSALRRLRDHSYVVGSRGMPSVTAVMRRVRRDVEAVPPFIVRSHHQSMTITFVKMQRTRRTFTRHNCPRIGLNSRSLRCSGTRTQSSISLTSEEGRACPRGVSPAAGPSGWTESSSLS